MQPSQQRVIEEEAELRERLRKLSDFCAGEVFSTSLPVEEQLRLRRQQSAMGDYLAILQDRIVAFRRAEAAKSLEEKAGQLYEVYCEAVGGVAFNGDPLPPWKDFSSDPGKVKQADAWRAVAGALR